jgi:6-phosphogluconolactonase (cycloisomerase 2 family)
MNNHEYIGFVGCYTSAGQADPFESSHGGVPHDRTKIGKGVLGIAVDTTGKLSYTNDGKPIITSEEVENPSYLCILDREDSMSTTTTNNKHRSADIRTGGLCVVSEVPDGRIAMYSLNRCDDETTSQKFSSSAEQIQVCPVFTHCSPFMTGGSYPCHVIWSKNTKDDVECLIVSNYGAEVGVLSVFALANGTIEKPITIAFGPGSNVDPNNRQDTSHAHSTCIMQQHPKSDSSPTLDICCADLGSDAIVQLSIHHIEEEENSTTNSLKLVECGRTLAPPGSGPRSIMFNPVITDIAIVSLELTAQVWLIRQSTQEIGEQFTTLGEASLLPDNWPSTNDTAYEYNKGKWASDAVWSPCGRFVYAAARLHNSVSVFRLSSNNTSLEFVQRVFTNGLTPRCLCMSDCGRFIIIAHQHSHDISSFRRNDCDGTISYIDRLEVPNAACVKLIRPDRIGRR